jgi:hypothetical protein
MDWKINKRSVLCSLDEFALKYLYTEKDMIKQRSKGERTTSGIDDDLRKQLYLRVLCLYFLFSRNTCNQQKIRDYKTRPRFS